MKLEVLKALLASATPRPLIVTPTNQLYISRLDGPSNNVSNDMLCWDADAYIALRQAAPSLIACAEALHELVALDERSDDGTHGGPFGGAFDQARAALKSLEDA